MYVKIVRDGRDLVFLLFLGAVIEEGGIEAIASKVSHGSVGRRRFTAGGARAAGAFRSFKYHGDGIGLCEIGDNYELLGSDAAGSVHVMSTWQKTTRATNLVGPTRRKRTFTKELPKTLDDNDRINGGGGHMVYNRTVDRRVMEDPFLWNKSERRLRRFLSVQREALLGGGQI